MNPLEPPKIINPQRVFTFNETDRAELFCECQNCLPIIKATWIYENSTNIEESSNAIPSTNYYQSFLKFSNVSRSQNGAYKCKLENSEGIDETNVKLVIQTPPKIENVTVFTDLKVSKADMEVLVLEGTNFELTCYAESFPAPSISWTVNGMKIKDGNSLKGFNASESHEGMYECIAENIVKVSKKNFKVLLNFPPRVRSTNLTELNFTQDTEASIVCDIYGRPEPDITWKFEDKKINGFYNYTLKDNKKTLKFTANYKHRGNFNCEGKNEFGRISMDFIVEIYSKLLIYTLTYH